MNLSVVTVHFNDFVAMNATRHSLKNLRSKSPAHLIEWIVVDGGSNFEKNKDLFDNLKRESNAFISEKDGGIYDAMNKGLNLATGQYVVFMNAGDVFSEQFSINSIDSLIAHDPIMIWGSSYEKNINKLPTLKKARNPNFLWYGMPTHHQAILLKTIDAKKFGYDPKFRIAADFKLVCLMFKSASTRIEVVDMPLCIFELGGLSTTHFWNGLSEQQSIRRDVLNIPIYFNLVILILKASLRLFRVLFPKTYGLIRYKKQQKNDRAF